ncbi:MAG: hypothetical protein ACLTMP_12715 [Eggerthella lenta]
MVERACPHRHVQGAWPSHAHAANPRIRSRGQGSGILGILALSQVLPAVIMKAYGIIYFVPELPLPLPVDPGFAERSQARRQRHAVRHWAAVAATLRERPAQLMLPRARRRASA